MTGKPGPDDGATCIRCGTKRVGQFRYCRVCGYDFEPVHGAMPAFEPLVVEPAAAVPPTPGSAATPPTPGSAATPPTPPAPERDRSKRPVVTPIARARRRKDGATPTIGGVLTIALGAVDAGRGGFVQDESGGIVLSLDAPVRRAWPAGTTVTVKGSLATRHGERVIRLSETSLKHGGPGAFPSVTRMATGAASAKLDGMRVAVIGTIVGRRRSMADGLGFAIDDGSGPIQVVVGPRALRGRTIEAGMRASVIGPLRKREGTRNGTTGYRVHAPMAGDLRLGAGATESNIRRAESRRVPVTAPAVGIEPPGPPPGPVIPPTVVVTEPPVLAPVAPVAPVPPVAPVARATTGIVGFRNPAVPWIAPTAATLTQAPAARRGPSKRSVGAIASPRTVRAILLASAVLAVVLGSGEILTTAGVLGGFAALALLVYRELRWVADE